jgi:protein subunit release factor B
MLDEFLASSNNIHNEGLDLNISPEKETALQERMERLGVLESDLRETFVRSSGPGGQKVNKTSSCVFLVHLPTGPSVKCQRERSQTLNRFLAHRLLLDRIERIKTGTVKAEKARIEKLRRQKQRRSRKAKEKMLKNKHMHAEKKDAREKIDPFAE